MAKKKPKSKRSDAKNHSFCLSAALIQESTLGPAVQNGMGAFLDRDRALIAVEQRPRIGDSLDLDAAMEPAFPSAHRWDYIFSVADAGTLVALEPHTATDGEISEVISKKRNAKAYLEAHLIPQHRVSRWIWVSHGRTAFSKMEGARRRLDSAGIHYLGRSVQNLG